MSIWNALNTRFTFFPSGPSESSSLSAEEVYRKVWGGNPELYQKQQNPLTPSVAQGPVSGRIASALIHPTRIDLTLTPRPAETGDLEVAFLENQDELFAELARMADVIESSLFSTPISRIGFSIQVATTVNSSEEGNKVAMKAMPEQYRVKLTDEEDFALQVNHQRNSEVVPDIRINFVSKWSVEKIQVMRMLTGNLAFPGVPQIKIFRHSAVLCG